MTARKANDLKDKIIEAMHNLIQRFVRINDYRSKT